MKVVVTSLGETLESPVDQRFGRARYLVLYDLETGEWSVHDNTRNLEAAQGAGVRAGQRVLALGAGAVITGHCGPRAFATLREGRVAVYQEATGTVGEMLAGLKAGTLQRADAPDVEVGFGSRDE